MWLDFVPGSDNSADMGTKQIRSVAEFNKKDGVLTGTSPFLFESAAVSELMTKRVRVLRQFFSPSELMGSACAKNYNASDARGA
jgi:hypothetical protein